jgi:hypothetical protein
MSPSTKDKMSPLEGTRNGPITANEHKRAEPVGSDAKAKQEANEPKGSRQDVELEYAADQTSVEKVTSGGCGRSGEQASRTESQQSLVGGDEAKGFEFIEDEIPGLWTDTGA